MLSINVNIDDYIDKTFFIKKEDMVLLPKKKGDVKSAVTLSIDSDVFNSIDNDIFCALSDGFVNGYIESHKDITKNLLKNDYSYDDIKDITNLSLESIYSIENEL